MLKISHENTICPREFYEKFFYKYSKTIEYVKNWPTFKKFINFTKKELGNS